MLLHRHRDGGPHERALRRLGRTLADGKGGPCPIPEGLGHVLADERRTDVADDDEHDVVGDVPAVKEGEHLLPIERFDRLLPPDDRAPVGMRREGAAKELGVAARHRHVLRALPLLHHDLELARELGRVERGVAERVGEDVEAGREVSPGEHEMVDGVVGGGERVDVAARRLDLGGDLSDAACGRALEEHVLVHVRDAGFRILLVGGADLHPRLQRDDRREMIFTNDDMETVREREALGGAVRARETR